ncbi:hypothetical protein N7540_001064 [Penicillium herquei]|nr:hypothetical protein N7540_001064 [Penicillium herquei]
MLLQYYGKERSIFQQSFSGADVLSLLEDPRHKSRARDSQALVKEYVQSEGHSVPLARPLDKWRTPVSGNTDPLLYH